MTLALAGLIAGFLHVLSGPDHLAAMAPYAVEGQRRAWRTGVRWGLGHTAGVLGVGLLALMFRDALHVEALSAWGERCVGFVLIGIGIWGMRAALSATRNRADRPRHEKPRDHVHAAFAVGTVHGLAGSSHVLGIVPALLLPSAFHGGGLSTFVRRGQRRGDGNVLVARRLVRGPLELEPIVHTWRTAWDRAQRSPSPSAASGSCGVRDSCGALPRSFRMSSTSSCSVPDRRACSPHCARRSWARARHS